jgi:polyisoprenoid-binding protein YceI
MKKYKGLLGVLLIIIVAVITFVLVNNYLYAQKENPTLSEEVAIAMPIDATSVSEEGVYVVDTEVSNLEWEARKILIDGYVQSGEVFLQSGEIQFLDGQFVSGDFEIDMDSITVDTFGAKQLMGHLRSADFFDVENYSTAKFVISKVIPQLEENMYEIVGDLTIKGITNPVTMIASIYESAPGVVTATAATRIDRTLWDVRFGSGKFFDNLGDNIIEDEFSMKLNLIANIQK